MAALLLFALVSSCLICACVASSLECDYNCELPRCFCDNYKIPGGLSADETPQMVMFTFSDRVTGNIRKTLIDIFPDTLRNPQVWRSSVLPSPNVIHVPPLLRLPWLAPSSGVAGIADDRIPPCCLVCHVVLFQTHFCHVSLTCIFPSQVWPSSSSFPRYVHI